MDIGLSLPSIQNHHLSREGNLATLEILATNFAFETYLREMLCLDMFSIDLILPTRIVNYGCFSCVFNMNFSSQLKMNTF